MRQSLWTGSELLNVRLDVLEFGILGQVRVAQWRYQISTNRSCSVGPRRNRANCVSISEQNW